MVPRRVMTEREVPSMALQVDELADAVVLAATQRKNKRFVSIMETFIARRHRLGGDVFLAVRRRRGPFVDVGGFIQQADLADRMV